MAGSLNGSCRTSVVQKINPIILSPTKCEQRGDEYWFFYPKIGWQQTDYAQYHIFLGVRLGINKTLQSTKPDGIGMHDVADQNVIMWGLERRKEYKKTCCCVIS